MRSLPKWGWELPCFLILLILVGYQIFPPPVIGLANNSDFSYVLGALSICPADHEQQNNIYLVTDYFRDPVSCTFDFGLVSIEIPITRAATRISALFTGDKNFDLRALAALHLTILLAAFGILLTLTSRAGPYVRFGIPALFILIFSDVAYTGYMNSVYLDAPAYLFLLLTTATAAACCLDHTRRWLTVCYLIFGAALVFSKSQHAILGLGFAILAVVFAFRPARKIVRIEWSCTAVLLVASTATMLSLTPSGYQLFALYDAIFSRIAVHNDAPWDVLKEMGLGEEDLKYIDTHAQIPGTPVYDKQWSNEFLQRTSFGKLIFFYLRHPDVTLIELNRDLIRSAPILRPKDMANYREKDGYPPRTLATGFSVWSDLRSGIYRIFPYHVLLILLAPWAAWLGGRKWPWLRSSLLPLALMLSGAAVVEYCMAILTDALDNSRHLFVFQVLTELVILTIAAALLNRMDRRKGLTLSGRKPAEAVSMDVA